VCLIHRRSQYISTFFSYTTLFRSHQVKGGDVYMKFVDLDAMVENNIIHIIYLKREEEGSIRTDEIRKERKNLFIKRSNIYEALRSEEHTSELQSRFDLVCRLLLEK